MKSNLPVNRLSAAHRTLAGVSAQTPGPAPRKEHAAASSSEESGISLKVERHGRWALLSRAQTQLSGIQRSEQAIVASYRELLSLSRQLERSGAKSEALAARVETLSKQVQQGKALDGNLKLQETPPRVNYRLDRVDLLSRRPQGESLQIQLPDGRHISFQLAAGSTEAENFSVLKREFAKQNLSVTRHDGGQLGVRGAEDQLASPWVFRGQGVRVPAGNPVPIQLSREASELEKLQQGLSANEREVEKQRLKELLATLEQERRSLEAQRQQLLQQIRMARASGENLPAAAENSQSLRHVLENGDFTLHLNALMAQANVSRYSVVALLGR